MSLDLSNIDEKMAKLKLFQKSREVSRLCVCVCVFLLLIMVVNIMFALHDLL